MGFNQPTLERQLEVYKQFYEDEVRKREEAEKGIKDLENICNDYREMLYRQSNEHIKEIEDIKRESKDREQQIESQARRDSHYSDIKAIVEIIAGTAVVPILAKLSGCSWIDFMKSLAFLPPLCASFIILVEFFRLKFFNKQK